LKWSASPPYAGIVSAGVLMGMMMKQSGMDGILAASV
jgi:hypothetical protein